MSSQDIRQARLRAGIALDHAACRLHRAICGHADRGLSVAIARYFFGDAALYGPLHSRVCKARRKLRTARIEAVFYTDPARPDQSLADAATELGVPAYADPPNRIVLLPAWFDDPVRPLRPGRIIHELFHMSFKFVRNHDTSRPQTNAFAYQGLVCDLAGLRAPRPQQLYPERISQP